MGAGRNSRLRVLFFLAFFLPVSFCLAQSNPFNDDDWNTLTLETYYPSPYGEYEELRTYYFTVGSGYAKENPGDGNMVVSGTVGIGTKSPDTSNYKLDIEGNANVKGNANVSADLTAGRICLSGTCRDSFSSGSGTQNKIAKWTSGSDLGDSSIQDDGSKVAIWGKPVVIDSAGRNPVGGYSLSVDNLYLMGSLDTAQIRGSVYGYTYFANPIGIKKAANTAYGLDVLGSINVSDKLCINNSCKNWSDLAGSGGSSGVTSIVAGSGISISPTSGTGAVTVSATGVIITNPDVVYGKTTSAGVGHLTKWAATNGIMDSNIYEDPKSLNIDIGNSGTIAYKLNVGGVGYFAGDVLVGGKLCFGTSGLDCSNSWSGGGAGGQWQTKGNNIYYDKGNVAIGKQVADTALDVIGIITTPGGGATSGGVKFSNYGSQVYEGTNGHLIFRKGQGSDTRFYFEKNNGVNIARLDHNGNLYIAGSLTQNNNFSDIRVKKDISDIADALSVINKLHPVRYRFIDKFLKEHESFKDVYYYNFIAQEFEKVFPDSVTKGDDGYLRIDIHNVSIYLTAAVQELSRKIETLEAENNSLKEANVGLESRISALEQMGNK